jgi:chromosome segregation ATPase
MWPKLLLEFLPHLSRLIPAADNYLNSRKESDKALQSDLRSLTDEIRNGFARAAEEQSALKQQLKVHIASSTELATDLVRLRGVMENFESRLNTFEKRLIGATRLLWGVLGLLAAMTVVLIFRTLR